MADKTSKYFFRNDEIDSDIGEVVNIPPDVEWAVTTKKTTVPSAESRSNGGDGSLGGLSGDNFGDDGYNNWTEPDRYSERKPQVPQILGIRKQEVSQDPQGAGAISVTFMVTEIPNVEYEMRVTRG